MSTVSSCWSSCPSVEGGESHTTPYPFDVSFTCDYCNVLPIHMVASDLGGVLTCLPFTNLQLRFILLVTGVKPTNQHSVKMHTHKNVNKAFNSDAERPIPSL